MSCRYLKIEDFCSTGSGGTPSRAKPEYYEGGDIPWIKSGDLKDSKIYEANEYITAAGLENSSAKIVEKDSILIAMYGATVGRLAILGINAATNQAICNIRPDTTIADMKYLYYFLKSKFSYFVENAVGGAQPNISQGLIKSLEVPLPSLDEQKRIADILDKAAGVCQKREQAIKLADDFLRATFLEIFGDPVKNPKGWKKNKIKKGVLDITSGWSATGENIPCKSDEFGVLKISSVTSGIFKPEENKMVDSETILASKKLIFPKKGDLLFSRANTRELVAAICMVHQDYDNLFLPDKLWSIKLDHDLLLPEFFLVLIQNEKIRDLLTKQATGTSGSMLNISKNKFEETEIIFPEINVQKYFCNTFRKTINLKEKLIKSNELANESFNSLSQKVFLQ
ncbi:restriction endonuclease subunit S [Escherichia coli]|uniref:Restriction endonuclease subunit S n=30 Tax=Escherichia coli TaxID=562 RepID=A0AAP1WD14_ECOLX|nr:MULTISPECIES: restriction endonuclease subunit S [Enterobacteriaceae]EHX85263.1 type I restriction modification DNA specificity domain protein [Escherichia coli DEC14C]EJH5353276.1 restriction endonuclease subunit S [Escherichia coli O145:H28]AKF22846.1 restriction endonuclease subunit S [Escherichia coli]AMB72847.1 Type I restriction enzyme EcoKI specificity protein [Escherichia coli]EEW3676468.1 restriction endonuclease subunit S [Escherichia coli]